MIRYTRSESRIELFTRDDGAILRLTLPGGSPTETLLSRDFVDRAALGDDLDLRSFLQQPDIAAALASTHMVGNSIIWRAAIAVSDANWPGIAWEAIDPLACLIRTSDVRPRVRQVPFTFPMRILEVGGPMVVPDAMTSTFYQSNRSAAVIEGAAPTLDIAASFPETNLWPTVEVLHIHGLILGELERLQLLKWLQPFLERYQTRLLVIDCAPVWLREARGLAQTLVDRAGPAVWLFETAFSQWQSLYDHLIHDRPLDWIRGTLHAGELFAGNGREELLRYSPLAGAFENKKVIKVITGGIPRRRRTRAPIFDINIFDYAKTAIEDSINAVHIPAAAGKVDFNFLDPPRVLRFGASLSKSLIQNGVYAPSIEKLVRNLFRQRATITVEDLAQQIHQDATSVESLSRADAAAAVSTKLQDISFIAPELRFEDHESEGMLPLAAKIEDARTLLEKVRGGVVPQPRSPRHVNTAFFKERSDGELVKLPQSSARLRPGQLVHFGIQIGEKDLLVVTLGSTAFLEETFRSPSGTSVEVGLTAIDFDLAGDPVQHLWLQPDKPSDLVTFAVRPRAVTTVPGIARLRVSLFHENNIVQSFLVAAALEQAPKDLVTSLASALHANPREVKKVGKVGYLTRLEYSAAPIMAAQSAAPRALTVIANESGGEKIVTIKGTELFRVSNDQNILDSVMRARAALDRASEDKAKKYPYMHKGTPNAGDPDTLLGALWDVAREGWDIFFRVAPDQKSQASIREQLASGLGIHAADIDTGAVVPWSLVYDRKVFKRETIPDPFNPGGPPANVERALCRASMPAADGSMPKFECGTVPQCLLHPAENQRRKAAREKLVCPDTVICPRRFWGFMHKIEVPVQQVSSLKQDDGEATPPLKKEIASTQPLTVVAAFNPHLGFATNHESDLKKIFNTRANLLKPAHAGREAVLDELDAEEPDIVYLFCHAIAELVDGSGRKLGPALDFGLGHKGVATDVLEDADLAGKGWAHSPLVFMNGCSTAGFSPYASSKFIKMFVRSRQASAVIGTEVAVWEVLATGFATTFLEAFLDHKPAGEALLLARRALLAKENPLGLVYTLYGSSELKIP